MLKDSTQGLRVALKLLRILCQDFENAVQTEKMYLLDMESAVWRKYNAWNLKEQYASMRRIKYAIEVYLKQVKNKTLILM